VTFDPVPWFIIRVRLGPSTPGDYVRARVLVPLKPGCDNSSLSWKGEGVATKIHRTVQWANGARGQRSSVRSTGDTWLSQRSDVHTGLSGVHWTVFDVPTGPKIYRSASQEKEGDRAPDSYCSCSVVHRTVRCSTRQKARIAFQADIQRLLAALGL
jgi:hypothetical protein